MPEPEFVDNGNAPEFFANGLYSVEVMGPVSRFLHYALKRSPGGVLYREACFACIMPNEEVGQAIALVIRTAGAEISVPRPRRTDGRARAGN